LGIFTNYDHKNIVHGNLSNDRIAHWRLLLEEYGPEYVHVSGKENIIADVLSRLATSESAEDEPEEYAGQLTAYVLAIQGHAEALSHKSPEIEQCLAEAFMETEMSMFPMSPKIIANEQSKDKELQESLGKSPDAYEKCILEGCELVMHAN